MITCGGVEEEFEQINAQFVALNAEMESWKQQKEEYEEKWILEGSDGNLFMTAQNQLWDLFDKSFGIEHHLATKEQLFEKLEEHGGMGAY